MMKGSYKINSNRMIDYSDPVYNKRIESDNLRIYKNLIRIYIRKPVLLEPNVNHSYQQAQHKNSRSKQRILNENRIKNENLRFMIRLLRVKPTKYLSNVELSKRWNNLLSYKQNKKLNKTSRLNTISFNYL